MSTLKNTFISILFITLFSAPAFNGMPQKWQAATVDGKSVDCYQVLSFTASSGQLNPSFR